MMFEWVYYLIRKEKEKKNDQFITIMYVVLLLSLYTEINNNLTARFLLNRFACKIVSISFRIVCLLHEF